MRETFVPFVVAALVVVSAWSSRGADAPPDQRGTLPRQDVPHDPPAGIEERVEWIVERAREARGLEALSLSVHLRGEEVLAAAWGEHAGSALEPDTPMPVGAAAHYLLVAAVLHAAEEREIDLDSPIATLLPGHDLPWEDVTLRMVLTHTSGFPDLDPPRSVPIEATAPRTDAEEDADGGGAEPRGTPLRRFLPEPAVFAFSRQDDDEEVEEDRTPLARERLDAWLPRLREAAVGPAGESVRWSNANLLLALLWLEHVTDERFESYVRRRLLPAAAVEVRAPVRSEPRADSWSRVRIDLGRLLRQESAWPAELRLDGLAMTPADLIEFHRAIATGELLSEGSAAVLFGDEPVEEAERDEARGHVLHRAWLDTIAGRAHGGAVGRDATRIAEYTHVDLVVALTGRGGPDSLASLERAIARAVLDLPQSDLADLPLPDDELARYQGHYRIGSTRAVLAIRDGRLELRMFDGTYPLAYQGGGRFAALDGRDLSLRFVRDSNGRATRFELRRAGVDMVAQRVD